MKTRKLNKVRIFCIAVTAHPLGPDFTKIIKVERK